MNDEPETRIIAMPRTPLDPNNTEIKAYLAEVSRRLSNALGRRVTLYIPANYQDAIDAQPPETT